MIICIRSHVSMICLEGGLIISPRQSLIRLAFAPVEFLDDYAFVILVFPEIGIECASL